VSTVGANLGQNFDERYRFGKNFQAAGTLALSHETTPIEEIHPADPRDGAESAFPDGFRFT
jgi:hypothetical protein